MWLIIGFITGTVCEFKFKLMNKAKIKIFNFFNN